MRTVGRWFLVAMVCFLAAVPAGAEDLNRFLPANLMLLMRVKLQPFEGPGMVAAQYLPELGKALGAMDKEVENQLGCLPQRDLQAVGLWMTDEFNVNGRKVKPRNAVGFVQGVFQTEKVWSALTDLANKFRARKPDTSLAMAEQGGRKIIQNRSVEGTFITPSMFALGRHETMQRLYGQTAAGFSVAPDLQKAMEDARFFLMLDFNRAMNAVRQCPMCKIPGFVFEWLKAIQTVAVYDQGGTINLQIAFDNDGSAALMKKTLEVAVANWDLLLAGLERDLDSRIASGATVMQLLGELRVRKIAMALDREAMKNLKIDQQGKAMTVQFLIPEVFKARISASSIMAVAAVAAVTVGPKLMRLHQMRREMGARMGRKPEAMKGKEGDDTRQELNRRACQANLRKIRRAVEQYNQAHKDAPLTAIKDADVKAEGLLTGEMKELFYPQPDCSYSSNGDLTKDGKIGCAVHGDE